MFLGNPEYECDLQPIDFARVAEGFGIRGFRIDAAEHCGDVVAAALAHDGPALIEAPVDPNEPLLPPKRMKKYAANLEKVLNKGTAGAEEIRAALNREPARTMLQE
jgi:pyruvate dehydrogenase (quinone)